jgi:signal transduction histidine kinase
MSTPQTIAGPGSGAGRGRTAGIHVALFGMLIGAVCAYFFWQVGRARQTFQQQVTQSTQIIAGVIERNARGAVLSQAVVEEIMQTFLGNMARFVDSLDRIEPFSPSELAAFAAEAGLAGIRIQRPGAAATEGPPGWLAADGATVDTGPAGLRHLPRAAIYYLAQAREKRRGGIVVGIASDRIETLNRQIGLPYLLQTLGALPGIRYLRLDPLPTEADLSADRSATVTLQGPELERVAEARLALSDHLLVVGIDATLLARTEAQLWREFLIFSALLASLAAGMSWLLQRIQLAHLAQVGRYERSLARQHQDASLGRATAAIAHEVKNPLNAIAMGLQRLKLEAAIPSAEHRQLVDGMLAAVQRADGIISGLRRYARPLQPKPVPIRPAELMERVLPLYADRIRAQNIRLEVTDRFEGTLMVDPPLMEEVLENLIRNAIEAQIDGGHIAVAVQRQGDRAVWTIENDGSPFAAADAERILEPYFTTKTRGSGLGLPIAVRIVQAHGGRLTVEVPAPGKLRLNLQLPADRHPGSQMDERR